MLCTVDSDVGLWIINYLVSCYCLTVQKEGTHCTLQCNSTLFLPLGLIEDYLLIFFTSLHHIVSFRS